MAFDPKMAFNMDVTKMFADMKLPSMPDMSALMDYIDLSGIPYPAMPPAHWPMVAEVSGRVLMVPLGPSDAGDRRKCRPIGCYEASEQLAQR